MGDKGRNLRRWEGRDEPHQEGEELDRDGSRPSQIGQAPTHRDTLYMWESSIKDDYLCEHNKNQQCRSPEDYESRR